MTLPCSPNSISMSQVNTELGYSSTSNITLNDTAVRALAVKPSGTITMDDLRCKSSTKWLNIADPGSSSDSTSDILVGSAAGNTIYNYYAKSLASWGLSLGNYYELLNSSSTGNNLLNGTSGRGIAYTVGRRVSASAAASILKARWRGGAFRMYNGTSYTQTSVIYRRMNIGITPVNTASPNMRVFINSSIVSSITDGTLLDGVPGATSTNSFSTGSMSSGSLKTVPALDFTATYATPQTILSSGQNCFVWLTIVLWSSNTNTTFRFYDSVPCYEFSLEVQGATTI